MERIDINQVKTIVTYSLRIELRGRLNRKPKKRTYRNLINLGLVYIFSGAIFGFICGRLTDSFSGAFIAASYFMVMIGSYLMLEYPTLVTGPEDFFFYAVKPVNAATFFCGKIASILAVISLYFLLFIIPYSITFLIARQSILHMLAHWAAIYTSGIISALLIVNLYGLLVKYVPYRTILNVASIFQLVLIMGSYFISFMASFFIRQGSDLRIDLEPWLLVIPSSWAAALFRITTNNSALAGVGLALIAIPLLLYLALRFISLDYAAKISENALKSAKKSKKEIGSSVLWHTPESYAISRLIINHLKYNTQFRMGLLIIIPITVLYFFMAIFYNKADILDPFTADGRAAFAKTYLLYIAIGFFPVMIKNNLSYSSEAEAGWIFFTSPASRIKLVNAGKKFIILFFLMPYLVIFAVVFFLFTGALLHTLMHFIVIFLMSLILVNIFIYFFAEMPFVKSPQKGVRTGKLYIRMLLGFILPVPLLLFVYFLYTGIVSYVLLLGGLVVCLIVIEVIGRKFAARVLDKLEFQE